MVGGAIRKGLFIELKRFQKTAMSNETPLVVWSVSWKKNSRGAQFTEHIGSVINSISKVTILSSLYES